jgi:hypothetical protein
MKKITFILILQLIAINSFSQKVGISFSNKNEFLIGLPIPFEVYSESIPSDSIIVTSTIGKIQNIRNNGRSNYLIIASNPGYGNIVLSKIESKDTVHLDSFYVFFNDWPNPYVTVGGKDGGYVSKDFLATQRYVIANPPVDICINLPVISYTITIFENDTVVFTSNVEGNIIPKEVQNMIKSCKFGGYVIFSKIIVNGPRGQRNSKPIEFFIKE